MDTGDRGAFADLLRRLRREAGLTQQELAERAGISVRSISDLERAISERPRRDTTVMLAAGLGLTGAARETFLQAARQRPRRATARPHYPPPPEPLEPLLGRAGELARIEDAVIGQGIRLLTLTGPGGVGKTRLATEAARELADRFADGVVFVRLDGLTDPALVLPTLAAALQLLEIGGERSLIERLALHLNARDVLVVLDNLEHVLSAAAEIADLVRRAPRTSFLATSRESLRVGGEHVLAVAPLPRPELATWEEPARAADLLRSAAVGLFVQRARAVRPDLDVDAATATGAANLAAIAEICHRLDGLPLAIELVAAQTQVLSPAAILALLKSAAPPLFASGARDQPARFQTMDAAIAWSYDLLSAPEQRLFRALSVFAAGFTLPAAAAVAGGRDSGPREPFDPERPLAGLDAEVVAGVTALARKNLLFADVTAADGATPRFRLLEPVRIFALERLREAGAEPAMRRRHAIFFADLAENLDARTLGPDPEIWLRQQAIDFDNFRGALDWALEAGEPELAVRLVCAIAQFWEITGRISEAQPRIARAIAVDAVASPAQRWFLRFWEGTFAFDRGDFAGAWAAARRLLEIAERHDNAVGIGAGHAALSRAAGADPDRHQEAADLARRAVDILEPLGEDEWTAWAWSRLGIECHELGALADARDSFRESLALRRRKSCEGCTAYSLYSLGGVSLDLDEPRAALDAYRESLALTLKHGNQPLLLAVLLGLTDVAWQAGADTDRARAALHFFGAAEAQQRRHGLGRRAGVQEVMARWQRPMRALGGDDVVDALITEGMALSQDEVTALAHDLRVASRRATDAGRVGDVSLAAAVRSIE